MTYNTNKKQNKRQSVWRLERDQEKNRNVADNGPTTTSY